MALKLFKWYGDPLIIFYVKEYDPNFKNDTYRGLFERKHDWIKSGWFIPSTATESTKSMLPPTRASCLRLIIAIFRIGEKL